MVFKTLHYPSIRACSNFHATAKSEHCTPLTRSRVESPRQSSPRGPSFSRTCRAVGFAGHALRLLLP